MTHESNESNEDTAVCVQHTHSSTKFSKFSMHMLHIVDTVAVLYLCLGLNKFQIRKQFVCYIGPTRTKISH